MNTTNAKTLKYCKENLFKSIFSLYIIIIGILVYFNFNTNIGKIPKFFNSAINIVIFILFILYLCFFKKYLSDVEKKFIRTWENKASLTDKEKNTLTIEMNNSESLADREKFLHDLYKSFTPVPFLIIVINLLKDNPVLPGEKNWGIGKILDFIGDFITVSNITSNYPLYFLCIYTMILFGTIIYKTYQKYKTYKKIQLIAKNFLVEKNKSQ